MPKILRLDQRAILFRPALGGRCARKISDYIHLKSGGAIWNLSECELRVAEV